MAVSDDLTQVRERLGRVGVWLGALRRASADAQRALAIRVEDLGYGSLWTGEVVGLNDVFVDQAVWLSVTARLVTGSGIANLWARHPEQMQVAGSSLAAAWPGRTLMGIGVSHGPAIARTGQVYQRPLSRMREYLDAMDSAAEQAGPNRAPVTRLLAALGPQMLELSRDRAAGAHTYFVPPEHTRHAREVLGPDRLLIPEQAVILTDDPERARAAAREHTSYYLALPNYVNNLTRYGFTEQDLAGGGSDRLVDSIVAWGGVDAIAARVREHLDAGADHVLVQPLGGDLEDSARQLAELAPALLRR